MVNVTIMQNWRQQNESKTRPSILEARHPEASLDELEALLLVRRDPGLEEDAVCPVLGVEQGHVAVHSREHVQAGVPLLGRVRD